VAKLEVIAALDIGTSKVSCVIGEASSDGELQVAGSGVSPCLGLRKGALVDPSQAVAAIEAAVTEAEREARYTINNVVIGLTSEYLTALPSHGVWAVSNSDGEVTYNDVRRVVEAARMVGIPSDREIIHVVPRGFVVDGQSGIRDPLGLAGVRLEVDAHVVAASTSFLRNLEKCVQRANLEIEPDGLISGAIASSLAALTEEERRLGTCLLDLGAGTVDLAVYCEGEVGHSAVLPVAGDLLTQDLARFFRISPVVAEKLKLEKGLASPDYLEPLTEEEILQARTVSGEGVVEVPRRQMAEVLEARLLDVLEWVGEEIRKAEKLGLVVTSLVMTGGTAQLPGLAQLAHRELEMPCRVASPCYPPGLPESLASPIYSGAVGLLLYAASRRFLPDDRGVEGPSSRVKQWLNRLGRWLAEVF